MWAKQLGDICSCIGNNDASGFNRKCKLWRRRFRVPFPVFLDLVDICKSELIFGVDSCKEKDICGNTICPVEIKLMGVLRVLGRGWCFDDVAEAPKMSLSVAQRSFHQFTKRFTEFKYTEYIHRPECAVLERVLHTYSQMGLPGCVGSTDCTHLKWDRCPISLYNLCKGKEGFPTLSYSVTVDHNRRILGMTAGFWGSLNDKTIVRHDSYVMDIKNEVVYRNVEYPM
jgi:hypothetical protein